MDKRFKRVRQAVWPRARGRMRDVGDRHRVTIKTDNVCADQEGGALIGRDKGMGTRVHGVGVRKCRKEGRGRCAMTP